MFRIVHLACYIHNQIRKPLAKQAMSVVTTAAAAAAAAIRLPFPALCVSVSLWREIAITHIRLSSL